jgi:putative addiction module component (TIGR02574 family)
VALPVADATPHRWAKLSTGNVQEFSYPFSMTQVTALLKEASKLDLPERVELVSSLLEDLDAEPHYVSDEEIMERLEELKSGKVKGLTEEEFWKACGRP